MENGVDEGGNMPKRSVIVMSIMIGLTSLLIALGCGTGDKGPVPRATPQDLVISGGTGTDQGGPSGPGGGGTGACVITFMGTNECYGNLTNSSCQQVASSLGIPPAWTSGATCQSLGYTSCSSVGSYTLCR